MTTNIKLNTIFRIHKFLITLCLNFVSIILILVLALTFYNTTPEAVNVPSVSNLITKLNGIELFQEKVYNANHTYTINNLLIIKNLKAYTGMVDVFDKPFDVQEKKGNAFNSKYYPQFKTLIVNTNNRTIERIKIPVGLFISSLLLFGVCVVYQVRKILISSTEGSPFVLENVNRIRYISLILICIPAVVVGFRKFLEIYLSKELNVSEFKLDWDMPVVMFVCYLLASLFFVIAFTLKKGIEMKVEQDLTI